jgi:hypothetical protein
MKIHQFIADEALGCSTTASYFGVSCWDNMIFSTCRLMAVHNALCLGDAAAVGGTAKACGCQTEAVKVGDVVLILP